MAASLRIGVCLRDKEGNRIIESGFPLLEVVACRNGLGLLHRLRDFFFVDVGQYQHTVQPFQCLLPLHQEAASMICQLLREGITQFGHLHLAHGQEPW